ncbi:MAG TPA: carboxypeptidase regulatory-like domain-containing protein [Sulfurovum sp.]|uniref:carboxypeptidase regulatory-like domain-containing protein n=1 Tax=Sulfurovum sp. TaxID=1969726 RepID=UPI002F95E06D
MKKLVQLLLLMTLPLAVMASELKEGTLSVLLFSEGKPLSNNEVKIDGKKVFKTDGDGAVKIPLAAGRHQVEIFGKNAAGENLGYFKKPVSIKEGRDTEVIATLSKKGADSIDIDVPVAVAKSVEREEEKATGEGRLAGQVLSSEGNTPISGARVFVRGTAVDVRTDENGRFSAKVPSGKTLSISVVHSAYSAQTIGGIVVKKDGTTSRTVKLTPASMELEEFVVLAPKIEGSIADVMAEEKNINAVANILGSAEISKKGDSDAASALKRVTGVTLVDGKNIYVRGLGDRYSNIEMNSLPLPSPDPTKRSVPLDIFPASVIGSMKVQKSATADIPNSFGGGYVDIRTKDEPSENFIKISLGIKGNSNTGKDSDNYAGSETDWLGYDNGYRAILDTILQAAAVQEGSKVPNFLDIGPSGEFTPEQMSDFTRDYVDRDYSVEQRNLPVGGSGSVEGAYILDINDENKVSIFGNYGYSQDHEFKEESYSSYDYNLQTNDLYDTPIQYGTIRNTTSNYSHGGMLNIGYNYMDVLKLKYTKLYTRDAEKSTRVVKGILGNDDLVGERYFLDWEERVLNADQINGEFDYELFNHKGHLDFGLEWATANLYQPNNYKYYYVEQNINGEDVMVLDFSKENNIADRLKSDDDIFAMYVKNKTDLEIFSKDDHIDVGFNFSTKERVSRRTKFKLEKNVWYYNPIDREDLATDIETIYWEQVRDNYTYETRPLVINTLFEAADYFDAEVDETSFYGSVFMKPFEKLELIAGAKYVDLSQTVLQFKKDEESIVRRVPEEVTINDIYPSFSAKYKYNENNHFDLALSRTYIVPDLREFTEGAYFHPYEVALVQGNPDLETTDIYSVDLKYSHYISDTENIKTGLFFKHLDKPIEDTQQQSGGLPVYSFMNSESAILYGIEFDGRKNFDFINNSFSNYYISGNFSYTESDVTLSAEQEEQYTNNHRQLQGLSNIVINTTLGYDDDERNVALSFNKMGERIRKVGLIEDGGDKRFPDTTEIPPSLLDFVWIEKFNDYTLKTKLGNLLDDKTIWKQGDNITKEFKTGTTFDISISYKY